MIHTGIQFRQVKNTLLVHLENVTQRSWFRSWIHDCSFGSSIKIHLWRLTNTWNISKCTFSYASSRWNPRENLFSDRICLYICFNLRQNVDQPTKGMLIALEQLASHVPQAHKQQIQIAFNNSAWHAISTGYMNSTKETFSVCFI